MGYDAATLTQKFVWSSTDPTSGNNQGAIWQSGAGPAADSAGNIYVETANGEFDADSGGINYSDSVVKLSANGRRTRLFHSVNESALNASDVDLGSAGRSSCSRILSALPHIHTWLSPPANRASSSCWIRPIWESSIPS